MSDWQRRAESYAENLFGRDAARLFPEQEYDPISYTVAVNAYLEGVKSALAHVAHKATAPRITDSSE